MVNRDATAAEAVLDEEDKVDAFRDQVFRIILTYMMGDPRTIRQGLSLILIARNLERIGDHATNIAEEVIYWIHGRDIRHVSKRKEQRQAAESANGDETSENMKT
jgi:phosphate transport system protein